MNVVHKIPTSCVSLDRILTGGLQIGSVALCYGEAETGKTTLAIQCAVNCARKGLKTLFVDCDGTFSARRLSQIASKDFDKIAELVILMKPRSFREQTVVVEQLPEYIVKNFGLVIFDTVTSLYSVRVAESPEKTFELNRELNRHMALLAQIAKTQRIAVLITSQVRSVFNDTYVNVEPVGTRVLKFWADTIITLKPTESASIVKAILEKAPSKEEKFQPVTVNLKIEEAGIRDYPIR
jgi:RecA/RadA recombinase